MKNISFSNIKLAKHVNKYKFSVYNNLLEKKNWSCQVAHLHQPTHMPSNSVTVHTIPFAFHYVSIPQKYYFFMCYLFA